MNERLPPVEIDITFNGSTVTWVVLRASIAEGIDRSYRADVEIATPDLDVELESLLGDEVELLVRRGDQVRRRLAGLAGTIRHLGFADHRLVAYVSVIPAFALLKQQVCSRLFQEMSVRDIIGEVASNSLDPYGREIDFADTSRADAERDYCTQYRESDADFICRLLHEQGVCYEFVHDDGPERMVLRDDNQQYEEYANVDGMNVLPVIDHDPEEAEVESVQVFEAQTMLTLTSARSRDFDWEIPDSPLEAVSEGSDDRGWTRERYVHGFRRLIEDDLMDRSTDRTEAAALDADCAWGRSNAAGLRAGQSITISNADAASSELYLVTSSLQLFDENSYVNEFECVPATSPLRPRGNQRRPLARGPETALVVGPSSEEIHTDEHGRVQVQFFWQPEPSYDEGASCWIRCAQSWAGNGWGAQFIPRVGMEVIVEFLAGNPDRPLITGAVYNGVQEPTFDPSSDKTQSGWRSNSSPGGGGFNELRFEDAADSEEIYIHGQRDLNVEILNDRSQDIGNDDSLTVANDRSVEVGNDQKFDVGNDQKFDIGNDSKVEVGNDATLKVGNMQQVTVTADRLETIGASILQTVTSSKTVSCGGMLMLLVGGIGLVIGGGGGAPPSSPSDSGGAGVGGPSGGFGGIAGGGSPGAGGSGEDLLAHDLDIAVKKGHMFLEVAKDCTETIRGDRTREAKSLSSRTDGDTAFNAGANVELQAKSKIGLIAGAGLTGSAGADIVLGADKRVEISAVKELVLRCGDASLELSDDGAVVISGNNINVDAKGKMAIQAKSKLTIKGQKVDIN